MTIPHGEHGNSITALDFDTPWGTLLIKLPRSYSKSVKDATLKLWDLNLSRELYLDHSPLKEKTEEIVTPCP
ncbi:CFC_HP_G0057230.mRNA.1.CDS.1 [Saccharomyces cerevisiae]|nr:CFC_HP_G0057230.mRNA.1.CDS.1 [Saccharomyces cerevisiae]CAI6540776.1 CFC_HP_G0057230.mRNA.1.CDS.1 [Saccharomyces cerevisiae]